MIFLIFCLSVGGKEELRPYWQRYMSKALLLVFVVDSSNSELFPVAKQHLHELLASHPSLPLMVLANKQVSMTAKTLQTVLNKSLKELLVLQVIIRDFTIHAQMGVCCSIQNIVSLQN